MSVDNARFPHGLTLRARVALLVAATAGFAVAAVSLAAYFTMRMELFHELDTSLVLRAQRVATLQSQLPETLQTTPSVLLLASQVDVCFVGVANRVICTNSGLTKPISSGPEVDVASGASNQSLRTLRVGGTNYRVVAVPVGGDVALVLAESTRDTQTTLDDLGLVLFFVGVGGIVVAAVAGLLVGRAGLRPVERLTKAAERVGRTGDLAPIEVEGADEIGRLARSFNEMLATVATSRALQRQLVADAGHELRTPLTSLRTNLDLLAQSDAAGARGLAAPERAALLVDVRAQVEELSGLVADLVELARDDRPASSTEEVDLAGVVERAIERVRRRATGVAFDVDMQGWIVLGDTTALERAVTNLLDNAVKWSPPGGRVVVRLEEGRLTVSDDGPGIEDADLPYVFDRFYRSTDARGMPGSGLGLAIVRQAAERHGGSVSAGRAPTGGAQLVFDLPGRRPELAEHSVFLQQNWGSSTHE
ncbi:MAG: two-component system, OmpR family, sensor histidine kinase MprB [Actinomycetota bacterium]|nr:two-component system, OmpR family, sensor histidine kinase MprB [Actinomycetota bacterium]